VGLGHAGGDDEAGGDAEGGDDPDRGPQVDGVGHDAAEEGADDVAGVPPEAVDADSGGPPGGAFEVYGYASWPTCRRRNPYRSFSSPREGGW
jgi:hypothetical protein